MPKVGACCGLLFQQTSAAALMRLEGRTEAANEQREIYRADRVIAAQGQDLIAIGEVENTRLVLAPAALLRRVTYFWNEWVQG